jgi:hypothetical protein
MAKGSLTAMQQETAILAKVAKANNAMTQRLSSGKRGDRACTQAGKAQQQSLGMVNSLAMHATSTPQGISV